MAKMILFIILLFPHLSFGQGSIGTISAPGQRPVMEVLPWYVGLGMSRWKMGYGPDGQEFKALTSQFGYRFNRTVGTEIETSLGRSNFEAGEDTRNTKQNIYSLSVPLTPVSIDAFGWNFFELGIVAGGSYFDSFSYWAGYAAGRVSIAPSPNFAFIGQYRKYIGISDVAGSGYDTYSASPEDYTTLTAALRF